MQQAEPQVWLAGQVAEQVLVALLMQNGVASLQHLLPQMREEGVQVATQTLGAWLVSQ